MSLLYLFLTLVNVAFFIFIWYILVNHDSYPYGQMKHHSLKKTYFRMNLEVGSSHQREINISAQLF